MHPYTIEQRANEHWEALVAEAQQHQRAKDARQARTPVVGAGRRGLFTFGDTRRYAAIGAQARAEAWTGGHVTAGCAVRSHLATPSWPCPSAR